MKALNLPAFMGRLIPFVEIAMSGSRRRSESGAARTRSVAPNSTVSDKYGAVHGGWRRMRR
jgi:hypothetical protein